MDVPGAQQSAVAMGEPGIQLMDRDEYSLQVSPWAIASLKLRPCMCTHCPCCPRCAGAYCLHACLAPVTKRLPPHAQHPCYQTGW